MTLFNNKIYRYLIGMFFALIISAFFMGLCSNHAYGDKIPRPRLQDVYGYSHDHKAKPTIGTRAEVKEAEIERVTDDLSKRYVENPEEILKNQHIQSDGQIVRIGYVLERMGYPFLGLASNHITGYEPDLIKRVCKMYSWSCFFIPLHDFDVKMAFDTGQVDILIGRLEEGYSPIKGMLTTKTLLAFNYLLLTNDTLANITTSAVVDTQVLYVETGKETRKRISEKLLEMTLEARLYEFRTVKAYINK